MFKFDEICELIKLVGSANVASVEIEHAGSRLRIDGVPERVAAEAPTGEASSDATAAAHEVAAGDAAGSAPDAAGDDELHYVTSPIVGTFYRAPNPDAEPYVKVGDFVEGGQTLCIVEAMKLMNEIEADIAGTVVRVYPENAKPVEYGERLFAVRPN